MTKPLINYPDTDELSELLPFFIQMATENWRNDLFKELRKKMLYDPTQNNAIIKPTLLDTALNDPPTGRYSIADIQDKNKRPLKIIYIGPYAYICQGNPQPYHLPLGTNQHIKNKYLFITGDPAAYSQTFEEPNYLQNIFTAIENTVLDIHQKNNELQAFITNKAHQKINIFVLGHQIENLGLQNMEAYKEP
ncbi:MAG: hypothetical protein ACK4PR_10135, partial [Gammaproteobacteria bacterium]